MSQQVREEGLRVESNVSLKGNVRVPFINDHETYDKIVVIDDNKKLRIANRPLEDQNTPSFSFQDFITNSPKGFLQFFPGDLFDQGKYLVTADVFFRYLKSGYYGTAHRKLQFSVIIAPSILNFKHYPSDMHVLELSSSHFTLPHVQLPVNPPAERLPETEIDIHIGLFYNKTLITMKHNIPNYDNLDFNAIIKVHQIY